MKHTLKSILNFCFKHLAFNFSIRNWILILIINFFCFLIFFEFSSRLYLSLRRDADFSNPSTTTLFYYRELNSTYNRELEQDKWNVLLLGGSVLNPAWGEVKKNIHSLFSNTQNIPIRIHSLGMPSHTTRDSLIKYKLLDGMRFDKVLIYHGINDTRMNNYHFSRYKHDYSHVHWYRIVNPLMSHPELSFFATPFTLQHSWLKLFTKNDDDEHMSTKYGSSIKTQIAFASNLNSIASIAKKRGDDLIFSTYAYHLPENYSKEKFLANKLDYDKHSLPVEVWGEPTNIKKNIDIHNEIFRSVAKSHDIPCIEMQNFIKANAINFDDICHLTSDGSRNFAKAVIPLLCP